MARFCPFARLVSLGLFILALFINAGSVSTEAVTFKIADAWHDDAAPIPNDFIGFSYEVHKAYKVKKPSSILSSNAQDTIFICT